MKSENITSNAQYKNLSSKTDLRTLGLLTPETQKQRECWKVLNRSD